jgi:dTDP-4-dehydrorhamnose 3,5-epimerase
MLRFTGTPIPGAFIVEPEPHYDSRGLFARMFCTREFEERGLRPPSLQANVTFNFKKGTLRGLHYQVPPCAEVKLIRCTRGAVYQVIVDVRANSPSYLRHFAVELTELNRKSLYIPEMVATGYQALADGAEATYLVGAYYAPECERGVRYNDPALAIRWPLPVTALSDKDRRWPLLLPAGEMEVLK